VAATERVHMTLPDDDVVDSVMRGYLPRLRPDTVVIDHSTTAPKRTGRRVAQMAAEGITFLHAPVFMSPQMTRESTGIMAVAGPEDTYDAVRDVLSAMTGEEQRGASPPSMRRWTFTTGCQERV
jgi:3-hydroxyisobutyrate dehydrogenase